MYVIVTRMTLLIPAFSLLFAPPVLTVWLLCLRTLPYHAQLHVLHRRTPEMRTSIHNFGTMLKPRYVVGANPLDQ